jgi:hypothetical protein
VADHAAALPDPLGVSGSLPNSATISRSFNFIAHISGFTHAFFGAGLLSCVISFLQLSQ